MTLRNLIGAVALLSVVAAQAVAQRPPDDSNVYLSAPGLLPKKPKPGLPDVAAPPSVWPRLDPGSVLCRSEEDLSRLAARRRGETVEGPLDCQLIRTRTPITILQRRGAATMVRTTDPSAGGSGWTDAWLPDKAPR